MWVTCGLMVGTCTEIPAFGGQGGRIKDPFRVQYPCGFEGNCREITDLRKTALQGLRIKKSRVRVTPCAPLESITYGRSKKEPEALVIT